MNSYIVNLLLLVTAAISFFIVFSAIPTILRVAYTKNLFDEPNRRNVHKVKIPTLGGLAIFIGFLFSYTFIVDWFEFNRIPFLIPALLVIFGIGIKDDILVTAPIVKLMGQLIAAVILVGFGDIRITDFHGFFGINPDYFFSITITLLLFVFLTNGFNLIDGVDGLAATVAMVTCSAFGIWFYLNGIIEIPIMVMAVVGGLLAFLYYNMFSSRQKIFMGDTGSLLLGFVTTVISIRFMEANIQPNNHVLSMNSAPAVALGILIVPIVDTLRVFFLRLSQGKSPFTADKNHIHHRMLSLGYSHLRISLTIGVFNIGFVLLSYSLRNLGLLWLTGLMLLLGFLLAAIPSFLILNRKRKLQKKKATI